MTYFTVFLSLDVLICKVGTFIPVSKGLHHLECLWLKVPEAQLKVSSSAKEEFIGRVLGSAGEQEATERQDSHQALENWHTSMSMTYLTHGECSGTGQC